MKEMEHQDQQQESANVGDGANSSERVDTPSDKVEMFDLEVARMEMDAAEDGDGEHGLRAQVEEDLAGVQGVVEPAELAEGSDQVRERLHPRIGGMREPATVLGEALRTAGEECPAPGHEAHHIIPAKDCPIELQEKLGQAGIGINDAENGVWLPKHAQTANPDCRCIHISQIHANKHDYVATLCHRLLPLASDQVAGELGTIKAELQAGDFDFVQAE